MMAFRPRILQGPEVLVADSSNAFDDDGNLTDERSLKTLQSLMSELKALT